MSPEKEETPPTDQSIFNETDFAIRAYDKNIKNARIMLFVIAGLQLLTIFFLGSLPEDARWIAIGIVVFISMVFVGLGLWTRKEPYKALLIAIIVYGGLIIADAIFDPTTIYKGIILKVIAIVLLIKGMKNAKEAEELKKTFGND